jgi:hypothetical protein
MGDPEIEIIKKMMFKQCCLQMGLAFAEVSGPIEREALEGMTSRSILKTMNINAQMVIGIEEYLEFNH